MNHLFLESWGGRTPDELLALAATHRIDSLVLAFEEALGVKAFKLGDAALSEVEADVLAIEAMEREVNNGGYGQFFTNSSVEYVPRIFAALERIACPVTADLTRRALQATGAEAGASAASVSERMERADAARDDVLNEIDQAYYVSGEDIAQRLFDHLKENRSAIAFA
jgi:hypothetical protein